MYYLSPRSITTWTNIQSLFLEKYFPASRVASIRKEICGIRQFSGETSYEYWERFKKLCANCPNHQIPEQLLFNIFMKDLFLMNVL